MGVLSARCTVPPTAFSLSPAPPVKGRRRGARRPLTAAHILEALLATCALFYLLYRLFFSPSVGAAPSAPPPQQQTAGARPAEVLLSPRVCDPPTASRCLLVASHGALQWVDADTGSARLVHTGRGVYYGVLPPVPPSPADASVWVVSRPHNWRAPPDGGGEALLQIDVSSGELLSEAKLPTRFTHDALRHGDSVFVADTGSGAVVELSPSPAGDGRLVVARTLRLFTEKEHINTLALWPPLDGGAGPPSLWAVLHNLGPSQLVEIDLAAGVVVRRLTKVGDKSHGLSLWNGAAIMLSSGEGRLIRVDIGEAERLGDNYEPETLWTDPEKTFMKGLIVVGDVAYFGISAWDSRKGRDNPNKASELAAFDLHAMRLLWRRAVATRGLLNVVAAPQLGAGSTSVASRSWGDRLRPSEQSTAGAANATAAPRTAWDGEREVPVLRGIPYDEWRLPGGSGGGEPSTPRLIPLADKRAASTTPPHSLPATVLGNNAFVALRRLDVSALAARVAERGAAPPSAARADPLAVGPLWDRSVAEATNAVLGGREGNMARFKPGTQTAHLVFSDQAAGACFHFPWWDEWKPLVMPVVSEILGWYGVPEHEREARIVRLQLARMGPGGAILKHADKGGWATGLHRVHVPLITNHEARACKRYTLPSPLTPY